MKIRGDAGNQSGVIDAVSCVPDDELVAHRPVAVLCPDEETDKSGQQNAGQQREGEEDRVRMRHSIIGNTAHIVHDLHEGAEACHEDAADPEIFVFK